LSHGFEMRSTCQGGEGGIVNSSVFCSLYILSFPVCGECHHSMSDITFFSSARHDTPSFLMMKYWKPRANFCAVKK